MFCVQCGFEIEDGFNFCPNCGTKVVSEQQESVQRVEPEQNLVGGYEYCPTNVSQQKKEISCGELEKIADEIFLNAPQDTFGCAKHLSKVTGIEKREAQKLINDRYREWKLGKKTGKYPDTEYCPCCASKNIEYYHKSGIVITRQSSAFKNVMISSQTDGIDMLKCQRCGHKWVPKRKK